MNNTNNLVKVIKALESKLNLRCIFTEIQSREMDKLDFAHTVFKVGNEHVYAHLLIVTFQIETIVLGSDIYTTNEIVDKVKREGNKICIAKDGIYQFAI